MAKTRRERVRAETTIEIKEVALQQMAQQGAASLSLRSIAREMGMSAPALYRYFPDRDALVTALIVDAYNSLADSLEAANDGQDVGNYNGRFRAVAQAYRNWALAHPAEYALIYGTPIPGYIAPRDETVMPAARTNLVIGFILNEAAQAGKLTIPDAYFHASPDLQAVLDELAAMIPEEDVLSAGVLLTIYIFSRLHGLVWGELDEHFAPKIADSGELFEIEISEICDRLKL
ncbi:MAG: TetR/AcrR family transcriptional regulator [Anaerolineae bacterium]|nr:TetR/AcrR family transcriptional regulator [Anaerolineae bacterium]